MGSHDNAIYVYKVEEGQYKLHCKFDKHSSFVNSLDWSEDGAYIRSSDGAHEVLYYSMESQAQDTHGASNCKEMAWASNHIKHGDDRKGIWPPGEDKTHVNDVCLSEDGNTLLSGDDFGLVNLFQYPATEFGKGSRSYAGHSEHVTRVVFSQCGSRIFTAGGQDKAIIVWRKK